MESTRRPRGCLPDGHPRRLDRERRTPVDPEGSRLLDREPPVGRQRLRAHLRRVSAPRRAHGRRARAAQALHGRPRVLRALLAPLRLLGLRWNADRGPRAPGTRRRRALAVGLLDHVGHLQGGCGAEQGTRYPRCDRRVGCGDRCAPRRRPDPVRRLGVDLLRQRPDRYRHLLLRAALRPREPRRRNGTPVRLARRGHRHGEPHAPRLRTDAGEQRRLGIGSDDRRDRRVGPADGQPSS